MIGSSLSGKAVKVYRFDSEKYGTVMVRPLRKDYIIFFVADYICQFSDGQYHFFCKTYNKKCTKEADEIIELCKDITQKLFPKLEKDEESETKRNWRRIIKKIAIALLVLFGIYCMVVRFRHPELTETQLFLKIFGLC